MSQSDSLDEAVEVLLIHNTMVDPTTMITTTNDSTTSTSVTQSTSSSMNDIISSSSCCSNNNNNNRGNSTNISTSSTISTGSIQHRRSTRTALYVGGGGGGGGGSNRNKDGTFGMMDPTTGITRTTTTIMKQPAVVQFPRRWPGIGTTFQCTKLPPLPIGGNVITNHIIHNNNNNYDYTTTRPIPSPMDNEYPHCTQQEIQQLPVLQQQQPSQVKEETVVTVTNGCENHRPPQRKRPIRALDVSDDDDDVDDNNNTGDDDSRRMGLLTAATMMTKSSSQSHQLPQPHLLEEWLDRLIKWYNEQQQQQQRANQIADPTTTTVTNNNDQSSTVESTAAAAASSCYNKTYTQRRPRKRPSSALSKLEEMTNENRHTGNHICLPLYSHFGPLQLFRSDDINKVRPFDVELCTTDDALVDSCELSQQEQRQLNATSMLSYLVQWNYGRGRRSIKRRRRQTQLQREQPQQVTDNNVINMNTTTHNGDDNSNTNNNDSTSHSVIAIFNNNNSNETTTRQQQQQATAVNTVTVGSSMDTEPITMIPIDSLQTLTETNNNTIHTNCNDNTSNDRRCDISSSWYDRMIRDTIVTSTGDYRSHKIIDKYNVVQQKQQPSCHSILRIAEGHGNSSITSGSVTSSEVVWKAIHALLTDMLQKLRLSKSNPVQHQQQSIFLSGVHSVLYCITQIYQSKMTKSPTTTTPTDEIEQQHSLISICLQELFELYSNTRLQYVHLLDLWGTDGVDVETIDKQIDAIKLNNGIVIDCIDEMQHQLNVMLQWQKKVDRTYQLCNTMDEDNDRNDLLVLQQLLDEGKLHGIRSKAYVTLENKIERVNSLQNRILRWRELWNDSKETIKFTMALVRDIHRLKVRFVVGNEMLLFQQDVESWVERANIAIRSRISLQEINALIDRGLEIPLDLSEYIEKLQSRAAMALEWIRNFEEAISCPRLDGGQVNAKDLIEAIRSELDSSGGRCNSLNHLSLEGSRLPVEIDIAKILHIELDARSWMLKTKKLLPGATISDDNEEVIECNRKGKIEDLREHVAKAKALRDRFVLTVPEVQSWILDGEMELSSIVQAADSWLDINRQMIDGDCDNPISIDTFKDIVGQCNAIFANLGSGAAKLVRVLHQAECWYKQYFPMFVQCHLRKEMIDVLPSEYGPVQIEDLKVAIDGCDVSIPLKEIAELQTLVDKVENWQHRASQTRATKKNLKRSQLLTIDDLTELIDEAVTFHVDTSKDVAVLQAQYDTIRDWQSRATDELIKISTSFQYLRETLDDSFGSAAVFQRGKMNAELPVVTCGLDVKATTDQEKILSSLSRKDGNIHILVKSFSTSSNVSSCIVTPESELALFLEEVLRWCVQSIQYLQNQQLVFDKKHFVSFDRFILYGRTLCSSEDMSDIVDDLRIELTAIIFDQLTRLDVLVSDRGGFLAWCKKAESLLHSEDRRPSLSKVIELARSSEEFPATCDVVEKVRSFANKGTKWARLAQTAIDATGTEKLSIQEAKTLLDEGEAIGFVCEELKILRNGFRAARSWSNKVKRARIDEGGMEHDELEALIDEHTSLIVNMTEEATQLQTSMKRYCLCRRAMHSGSFMIACDECNDWFHGSCVGITEKRAVDRVAKYVCLRCSVSKTFKSSAMTCVNIIRKWVCIKEMKKFRQTENQKQKRKIRKESKDIETYQAEIIALNEVLKDRSATSADETMESQKRNPINDEINSEHPQQVLGADSNAPPVNSIDGIVSDHLITCTVTSAENLNSDFVPVAEVLNEFSQNTDFSTSCALPSVEVINGIHLVDSIDDNKATYSSHKSLSDEEILSKVKQLEGSAQDARVRMNELEALANQQKAMDNEELKLMSQLRFWVVRVRSLVLVPSTCQLAKLSKPKFDGTISDAMKTIIKEAELLGIHDITDVKTVVNAFHRMAWCILAASILNREPSATQIDSLIDVASRINLSDEKSIRSIKLLSQRVTSWQSRVEKALSPVPGDTKPYSLELLKLLLSAGGDIPVSIPMEQRLSTVIDDKGARYCLCGGPSDGRFMVSCDQCDRWFHGHCVKVQATENDLKDWKCPQCKGHTIDVRELDLDRFHENFDVTDDEEDSNNITTNDKLWPPFGLFGSTEASEILGEEVCRYQDSLNDLVPGAAVMSVNDETPLIMSTITSTAMSRIQNNVPPVSLSSIAATCLGYSGDRVHIPSAATLASTTPDLNTLIPSATTLASTTPDLNTLIPGTATLVSTKPDMNTLIPGTVTLESTTLDMNATIQPTMICSDIQSAAIPEVVLGFGSDNIIPPPTLPCINDSAAAQGTAVVISTTNTASTESL